jgi:hypothetical protein
MHLALATCWGCVGPSKLNSKTEFI